MDCSEEMARVMIDDESVDSFQKSILSNNVGKIYRVYRNIQYN